jgi:hypothetical protein
MKKTKSVREGAGKSDGKKPARSRRLDTAKLSKEVREIIKHTYLRSELSRLEEEQASTLSTIGGWIMRNSNQPRIIKGKPVYIDKASIGSADFIAMLVGGVTLWIEIKVGKDAIRASQASFLLECRMRGVPYIVCRDNPDGLRRWLDEHGYEVRMP